MKQPYIDQILAVIQAYPTGASLEEISQNLPSPIPRRTLQRWLASLVKEGYLLRQGKARACRYTLPLFRSLKEEPPPILLTPSALVLQQKIRRPLSQRKPVGYNQKFLEAYTPNTTFYLSYDIRQKLLALGAVEKTVYPAGTYAKQLFPRLLIDLAWNSCRLEGNTYSLLETECLLDKGKAAQGKDFKETQMILNHKAALEFLIYSGEEMGINTYTLLNLHTLLSDNLRPDPSASGRLRTIPVEIAHSVYHPLDLPSVIEECFNHLLSKAQQIQDPFEQAFFLMVHLPYLQPFDDVNKQTSRLAANIPLIRHNVCPLSFIDVPEELYIHALLAVYELNEIALLKDLFVWAYERSCILYSNVRKPLARLCTCLVRMP